MKFSVLIPVYNVEEYLEECIESVLTQDVDDYEIVLIDDGSTDRSGQICDEYQAKYPSKFTVVHKENEGLLMARRDALKLAKGDYILFLDSDDYYEPGALKAISEAIDTETPDIVIFNLSYVRDGEYIGKLTDLSTFGEKHILGDKTIIYNSLLDRTYNFNSLAMKCCHRECVGVDTDYSEYKGLNYGEDLLQSIEIFTKAQKVMYISNDIYCYRIGSGMMSKVNLKLYTDNKKVNKAFYKYIGQWNIENKEEKLARHFLNYVCDITRNIDALGNLSEETKEYLRIISQDEDFRKNYKMLRGSNTYKKLDVKERMVLLLLYNKWLPILYMIILVYIQIKRWK